MFNPIIIIADFHSIVYQVSDVAILKPMLCFKIAMNDKMMNLTD